MAPINGQNPVYRFYMNEAKPSKERDNLSEDEIKMDTLSEKVLEENSFLSNTNFKVII